MISWCVAALHFNVMKDEAPQLGSSLNSPKLSEQRINKNVTAATVAITFAFI
jgi:hypothetical protein